jgi:hypothetical protein
MGFIADDQLSLLILCFLAGCLGTAFLFRKPAGHRAWRVADLVWVVLGGVGAIAAVMAGLYTADTSRLDRQIDIAYAATSAFDRDAARFRLRFCDPAYDPDTVALCEKIEFLSASTASNADLPLFIAITERVAPLRRLNLLPSREETAEMSRMSAQIRAFDAEPFLVFATSDERTEAALISMRRKVPAIAGDFTILARGYEELVEQVRDLKEEWELLQTKTYILALQILALCMIAFAAPFRLGKSIVELR